MTKRHPFTGRPLVDSQGRPQHPVTCTTENPRTDLHGRAILPGRDRPGTSFVADWLPALGEEHEDRRPLHYFDASAQGRDRKPTDPLRALCDQYIQPGSKAAWSGPADIGGVVAGKAPVPRSPCPQCLACRRQRGPLKFWEPPKRAGR